MVLTQRQDKSRRQIFKAPIPECWNLVKYNNLEYIIGKLAMGEERDKAVVAMLGRLWTLGVSFCDPCALGSTPAH